MDLSAISITQNGFSPRPFSCYLNKSKAITNSATVCLLDFFFLFFFEGGVMDLGFMICLKGNWKEIEGVRLEEMGGN